MDKARTAGYWTTTAVVAFVLLTGGYADVTGRPETTAGVIAIGYPLYFVTLLGVWKLLGAVALLVPRFPRLKEWAYAGAFFNFSGAVVSHAVSGSGAQHLVWPGLFALCVLASWALRPASRTLGALSPRSRVRRPRTEPAAAR